MDIIFKGMSNKQMEKNSNLVNSGNARKNYTIKFEKLNETCYMLLLNSTAHGISNLIRTRNISIKIMWLIFLLASISVGLYYTISNIIDFLNYNTVTTIEVINEQQSEFPTVSLCGFPRFTKSIDEMILKIKFESANLNVNDSFEEFNDRVFGKCYRFNSGRNIQGQKTQLLNTSQTGLSNNLQINFNLSVPEENDFAELLINIHNQSAIPFDMENGGMWIKVFMFMFNGTLLLFT